MKVGDNASVKLFGTVYYGYVVSKTVSEGKKFFCLRFYNSEGKQVERIFESRELRKLKPRKDYRG